jgi:hypothetical protein
MPHPRKFQETSMIKLWGLMKAHAVAVLTVIPASVIGGGYFVVSSLAVPANSAPAPTINSEPPNPMVSTATATFTFNSSQTPTKFECSLDSKAYSTCTSPVSYSGLDDGQHVFDVEAVYGTGKTAVTSSPASDTWNVVPPAPSITSGPNQTTADSTATFDFTDGAQKVAFTCWIDSSARTTCNSGTKQYLNLATGKHCFSVFVTDNKSGINSATTTDCWTVIAPQTSFTVGGSLTSPLYPGVSEPLNLTFTNPNPDAMTVPSVPASDITISVDPAHASCAASNFSVAQGLTTAVTIPANQSTSLSALGVAQGNWPVIEMLNTDTNQAACQGASLTLRYSGIEATG